MSNDTVSILIPELILVLTATLIYTAGAFLPGKKFWGAIALLGIVAAAFVLRGQYHHWFLPTGAHVPMLTAPVGGPLAVDLFGQYIRFLALLVGGIFILTASRPQNEKLVPEYIGTVLMSIAGLMLVGGAGELTLLFLGLELISIPTYVLLFLGRKDIAGAESAAKYFFLSILSSAITLYGFSFLYGVGGSTRLDDIQAALSASLASVPGATASSYAQLALVLVIAGLGFKIAAVPFHFYAPDVYQGTTHANAGLLAVLPKIAGIAALIRIVSIAMPGTEETGIRVTMILAIITMTLGNVVALWQTDIRRMLAYSSIAHAGYMLVGLAVDLAARRSGIDTVDGVGAALFYVAVYSLATAGTFAGLTYLSGRKKQIDTLEDLAGIGRAYPATALAIAVFMFSLTGLPPLAGFWGKFELFSGAVKIGLAGDTAPKLSGWFLVLSVVGVLNAAVSAAYYLRIIGVMYFREPTTSTKAEGGLGPKLAMFACAALTIFIGLSPGMLSQGSNAAAESARVSGESAPAPSQHASR
ncbi:MAG: NADH-quinone oxidoreductase subunit N [Planctomycetia bacterium]|nr:NADH-quinone oxidoreductase subunit N [Planctomycetia bacterium]